MENEKKLVQIKNLINQLANEASDDELSALLEIAAFANTEYNRRFEIEVSISPKDPNKPVESVEDLDIQIKK